MKQLPFETRFRNWTVAQAEVERERERLAYLKQPPAPNPAHLTTPTRCRAKGSFYVRGHCVLPGTILEIERHDAHSLAAIGKVELLDLPEGER
jgi:hypothetical protein